MPVIDFSQKDILRGKIVTPGWYRVRIDSIGEKQSKDGGSTNYPVEGTIIRNAENGSEEFAGVPLDWMFNSKAIGFAVGFLEAFGVTVTPGQRVELAASVGQELDVFIETGEYQGRMKNNVPHKYRAPAAA